MWASTPQRGTEGFHWKDGLTRCGSPYRTRSWGGDHLYASCLPSFLSILYWRLPPSQAADPELSLPQPPDEAVASLSRRTPEAVLVCFNSSKSFPGQASNQDTDSLSYNLLSSLSSKYENSSWISTINLHGA
uniref:Uncharacterized protein n=1 Tax=Rangifer tarandus platyrhynchus TaxID=3082113 RepID=A0ACB0EGK1_RANTA|nr:unnamed protein product [Rangifer tarandus platyrhynchus]